MINDDLMLKRGEGRMMKEGWQVQSGLSMWYNMQQSKFTSGGIHLVVAESDLNSLDAGNVDDLLSGLHAPQRMTAHYQRIMTSPTVGLH